MKRTNSQDESASISTNSVAVESKQQPLEATTTKVERYRVEIARNVEGRLTGELYIYASTKHEAIVKARAKLDAFAVDEDIEMQDSKSLYWMSYEDVRRWEGDDIEIAESDVVVDEEEFGAADVF